MKLHKNIYSAAATAKQIINIVFYLYLIKTYSRNNFCFVVSFFAKKHQLVDFERKCGKIDDLLLVGKKSINRSERTYLTEHLLSLTIINAVKAHSDKKFNACAFRRTKELFLTNNSRVWNE